MLLSQNRWEEMDIQVRSTGRCIFVLWVLCIPVAFAFWSERVKLSNEREYISGLTCVCALMS